MPASEPFGQSGRLLAGVALLVALLALMGWTGATAAEPLARDYPDEVEVTPNPDAYVGDRVALGGIVVETDPVVIATRASGYGRFTVVNADESLQQSAGPLEEGDRVTAFGALADESTLDAERTITSEPQETLYMVGVSFVAGCWVLVRLVRGWRFDRARVAFVPRSATATSASPDRRRSGSDERDAALRTGESSVDSDHENRRAGATVDRPRTERDP